MKSNWDEIFGLDDRASENLLLGLRILMQDDNISKEEGGVQSLSSIKITPEDDMKFDTMTPNVYVLLFTNNNKFLGNAISKVTSSTYTHAAIAFKPDFDRYYDMLGPGLMESVLSNMKDNRKIDVFEYPLDPKYKKTISKIVKFFLMTNKLKYNALMLVKIMFGLTKIIDKQLNVYNITDKEAFICSAFVLNCLAVGDPHMKAYVKKNNIDVDSFDPKSLGHLPKLKYLKTYDCKTQTTKVLAASHQDIDDYFQGGDE